MTQLYSYTSIPTTDPADADVCTAQRPRRARTCASTLALRILMTACLLLHQVAFYLLDQYLNFHEYLRIMLLLFLIAVVAHKSAWYRELQMMFEACFYALMLRNALSIGGFVHAHLWHWSILENATLVAVVFVVSCVWYGGFKWVLSKYAEAVFNAADDRERSGCVGEEGEDVEKQLKEKL